MVGSEIVDGWRGKHARTELAGGGSIEGEIVRSDAVGVLLAVEEMVSATPQGPVVATAGEDSEPAFCFVPWSRVAAIMPFPGEIP